ncbi:MAG: AEC family transporter [Idiomarina sp.]|nr:AEC family transporter [Idiomarina sp.]
MGGFAIVLGFLLLGVILQKLAFLPAPTANRLIQYVLYVAMPAMVLLHLPALQVDATLWVPVMTPWAMLLLSMLSVVLLTRLLGWSREVMGALLIVVPLGNTSFLGFPIVQSFYGDAGLAYAVLYDQFGSFIGLAIVATTLAAIFGAPKPSGTVPQRTQIIRKVLTFPPFIALVIALVILFSGTQYPAWLAQLLRVLGLTLVPAVMVAVGLQLHFKVPRNDLSPFIASLGLKLVVLPLIAFITMSLLPVSGLAVQVSLLEAAMPPMITAGAIAMAAGLKPRLVSAIIGYGVLCSALTIPLWYLLIQRVFG